MCRTARTGRLLLAVGVLLALFTTIVAGAGAANNIDFRIAKYNCTSDPGQISLAKGVVPDNCTPGAGVNFTVKDTGGTTLASCTTDNNGLCVVSLPEGATVVVAEDPTTAKAGYVPRENPISTQVLTEFASAVFVNLPAAQLAPQTGQAVTTAHSSELPLLIASLGLAALGLGLKQRRRA